MRYQHRFLDVIPLLRSSCSRVTHPCATWILNRNSISPFDLHVLGTPPAFVLSQDQTLEFNSFTPSGVALLRLAPSCPQNPRTGSPVLRLLQIYFAFLLLSSALYSFQGARPAPLTKCARLLYRILPHNTILKSNVIFNYPLYLLLILIYYKIIFLIIKILMFSL